MNKNTIPKQPEPVTTEFLVTETYRVFAPFQAQIEEAVHTGDFSCVELVTIDRKIKIEPNF
jgi:hypothetical protein